MTIEIVDFPIKNGDFPLKMVIFPLKMVIFPWKRLPGRVLVGNHRQPFQIDLACLWCRGVQCLYARRRSRREPPEHEIEVEIQQICKSGTKALVNKNANHLTEWSIMNSDF